LITVEGVLVLLAGRVLVVAVQGLQGSARIQDPARGCALLEGFLSLFQTPLVAGIFVEIERLVIEGGVVLPAFPESLLQHAERGFPRFGIRIEKSELMLVEIAER